MTLSDEQIEYIETNLTFYGVAEGTLKEDLTDHICTYIEQSEHTDFETAYKEAIQNFGGHYAMSSIQRQTLFATTLKKQKIRTGILYTIGFIAVFSISTGFIFKIMHWPGASVITLSGFMLLNLVVLPLFFYDKYKSRNNKIMQ